MGKDGAITFDDRADSEELGQEGFHAESVGEESEPAKDAEESPTSEQDVPVGLTVEIPLDKVNAGNLTHLLDAKGALIKKALNIPDTPIEIIGDTVKFSWFAETPSPNEVKAYTHFISALCEMNKNQKRITATEKTVDNEKYDFRCFLLRLGFIVVEYKEERKILFRNLSGSSAFKSGHKGGADDVVFE